MDPWTITCWFGVAILANLVAATLFDAQVKQWYWSWARTRWTKPKKFTAIIPPLGLLLFGGLLLRVFWENLSEYLWGRY